MIEGLSGERELAVNLEAVSEKVRRFETRSFSGTVLLRERPLLGTIVLSLEARTEETTFRIDGPSIPRLLLRDSAFASLLLDRVHLLLRAAEQRASADELEVFAAGA